MKLIRKVSLRTLRRRLSSFDSIPQFAILGIASGLVTGLVIVAFRLLIEIPLELMFGINDENFEELDSLIAGALPIIGAIALVPLYLLISPGSRRVGVVHVMERLARHQGHMPIKNALVPFFAGVIALGSCQSGGREGPAVHLGAAGSSLIGHYLELPNNSIRVLVGCGAAAAISASFNTPIAGVIFSMEVIIMEYTIAGFIPVILAAVVAALVTQLVFGSVTAFDVPPVSMASFLDLRIVIIESIFIGVIAAMFIRSVTWVYRVGLVSIPMRLLLAGTFTGAVALMLPQVMGSGYDTVDQALLGELGLVILISACLLKILTSAATVGLGIPVGLIGPSLFIGAMAAGMFAFLAGHASDELSVPAFYVTLGMGAMMGAVLQAPLAALMAIIELTGNPNIILPAMLAIIIADMTTGQLLGLKSVFLMQMEALGLEFRQNPLSMALNRASVASIMIRNFERVKRTLSRDEANVLVRTRPIWLLVDNDDGKPNYILRTEDLVSALQDTKVALIDLSAIPATRKDVFNILLQATLKEALDALNERGVQALYVNRISAPMMDSPVGIVTREDVESFYQF